MASGDKHLEITLETQVESVNLAEEMCLRVAEAAGFGEDDCYRIGMSVREGVINAFHYGNQERPEKKIHLALDITRSEEYTSELQSHVNLVCRLLLEKKKKQSHRDRKCLGK